MPLNVDFDGDLLHAINDLPQTVTINSVEYSVIADTLDRSRDSELEGIYAADSLDITMMRDDLDDVAIGTKVTYLGVQFRIVAVRKTPEGEAMQLTIEALTPNSR